MGQLHGLHPSTLLTEPETATPQAGASTQAALGTAAVPQTGRSQTALMTHPRRRITPPFRPGVMRILSREGELAASEGEASRPRSLGWVLASAGHACLPQGREGRNHSPRKLLPRRWLRHSPDGFCRPRRPSVPAACLGHWTSMAPVRAAARIWGGRRPWSPTCRTSHIPGGCDDTNGPAASPQLGPAICRNTAVIIHLCVRLSH